MWKCDTDKRATGLCVCLPLIRLAFSRYRNIFFYYFNTILGKKRNISCLCVVISRIKAHCFCQHTGFSLDARSGCSGRIMRCQRLTIDYMKSTSGRDSVAEKSTHSFKGKLILLDSHCHRHKLLHGER